MSRAAGQLDLENAAADTGTLLIVLRVLAMHLLSQRTCMVDDRDRQSKRELDYGDSSWPLYSMYSKIAQQDDNRLAERCQRDTNGTMVFVSPLVTLL